MEPYNNKIHKKYHHIKRIYTEPTINEFYSDVLLMPSLKLVNIKKDIIFDEI